MQSFCCSKATLTTTLAAAAAAAALLCALAVAAAASPELDAATRGLAQAAREGNLEGVREAVAGGASLNERLPQDGFTALMAATLRGHTPVVEYLVGEGADPHVRDHDGFEAIHGAGFQGRPEAARVLLGRTTAVPDAWGPDNYTALHRTTWGGRPGHLEAARVLVEFGADTAAVHGPSGNTPLHEAARRGNARAAEALAGAGAPLEALNLAGQTPLALAAAGGPRGQAVALALLQAGADPAPARGLVSEAAQPELARAMAARDEL